MKVFIAGTPLQSMVWRKDVPDAERRVHMTFRPDTDYQTKLDFLRDLSQAANRLRMDLFKEWPPGHRSLSVEELEAIIGTLPKPTMSSDELEKLLNGVDPEPWERRGSAIYTEGDSEVPGSAALVIDLRGRVGIGDIDRIVDAHNKHAGFQP